METLLFWVGVAVATGTVALIVATAVTWSFWARLAPNVELQREIRTLAHEFSDFVDIVERRQTRERVRKMRDGKEAAQPADVTAQPGTPEYKAMLRRQLLQRGRAS